MNNALQTNIKMIGAGALAIALVSTGIAFAFQASAQTVGENNNGNSTTTTATSTNGTTLQERVSDLEAEVVVLRSTVASLQANIDALWANMGNNGGNGTSTPPTYPTETSINPQGASVRMGTSIDWSGRGFWFDEPVKITNASGEVVGMARADGGGNFTTGSMAVPGTLGNYTYTFRGEWSGMTKTATFSVVP